MNELIVNNFVVHIFLLSFSLTVLLMFTNNYIRHLGQKKQLKLLCEEVKAQRKITDQIVLTHEAQRIHIKAT